MIDLRSREDVLCARMGFGRFLILVAWLLDLVMKCKGKKLQEMRYMFGDRMLFTRDRETRIQRVAITLVSPGGRGIKGE